MMDSDDDLRADLGIRLRIARQAAGLTLRELEAKSNGEFRRSTVGSWERGETAVTVVSLIRLAYTLGITPAVLVQGYPRIA